MEMSRKEFQKTIARELRDKRDKADIKQIELANRADLSDMYISMIERGLRIPTVYVWRKIIDVLESEID